MKPMSGEPTNGKLKGNNGARFTGLFVIKPKSSKDIGLVPFSFLEKESV